MKKKQTTKVPSETDKFYNQNSGTSPSSHTDDAEELSAPRPYTKFLPEPTEEIRMLLKNAHGEIKYSGTNNYIFSSLSTGKQ